MVKPMYKKLLLLLVVILVLVAVVILGTLGVILPWFVTRTDQATPRVVDTGPTQAAMSTVTNIPILKI